MEFTAMEEGFRMRLYPISCMQLQGNRARSMGSNKLPRSTAFKFCTLVSCIIYIDNLRDPTLPQYIKWDPCQVPFHAYAWEPANTLDSSLDCACAATAICESVS